MHLVSTAALALMLVAAAAQAPAPAPPQNPFLALMDKAAAHAKAHGATSIPVLSPVDRSIGLPDAAPSNTMVPVHELQSRGIHVVPWTTNDPERMRQVIRAGVDGLISDRPDLLQAVVREERAGATTEADRARLATFDVTAHRGGRGLRPENTLPSFESGLDQLANTLETDTGVTRDHVSLIWHDQFLNPESCRRADGKPYTFADRVYIRDLSLAEAQSTFVCDKLHFGPDQKNQLSISPVSLAFAQSEHMPSPYAPTYAAQLFRFVRFYAKYYGTGPGRTDPHAVERAANAERVRFNLETKIQPNTDVLKRMLPANATPEQRAAVENHTFEPQVFVDTLTGEILREHMETRSEIQSFDFRTLQMVEEQHPQIPTYYLTQDPALFSTDWVPASLRLPATR